MNLLGSIKNPLKTALAAAFALLAYRALHLAHGYWAVISAVIVMQSNLGRSIRASSNRLLGTIAGAGIGTLVLWMGGSNALTLAIAVGLTVWALSVAKLHDAVRLGGVTATIVLLIPEGSAWQTGWNRFVDVMLGVVVALVVSLAWPSRARTQLRESLAQTFAELGRLLQAATGVSLGQTHDPAAIESLRDKTLDRARRNADLLRDLQREPSQSGAVLALLAESAERMRGHLFAIDNAARQMTHDSLHRALRPEMEAAFESIIAAFAFISRDLGGSERTASMPDMDSRMDSLEQRLSVLRSSGATLSHDVDETLRLYALIHRLRQLVPELTRSAEFANVVANVR